MSLPSTTTFQNCSLHFILQLTSWTYLSIRIFLATSWLKGRLICWRFRKMQFLLSDPLFTWWVGCVQSFSKESLGLSFATHSGQFCLQFKQMISFLIVCLQLMFRFTRPLRCVCVYICCLSCWISDLTSWFCIFRVILFIQCFCTNLSNHLTSLTIFKT